MRFLYEDRVTFVHRMSPQAKVMALLVSFVLPSAFNHPSYVAAVALVVAAYGAAAGAWRLFVRFWRLMAALLVVSCVLWSFLLKEGEPIVRVGFLWISEVSLLYGVAMGLRIISYVALGLVFLYSTSVEELSFALRRMGLPYGLGFALSASFRLVPAFVETTRAVSEAQRSRGLALEEGGPIERARKYVPLLVPILGCCMRRANSMAMALEARAFRARGARTCLRQTGMRRADWAALAAVIATAVAALALRFNGYGVLVAGRL